MNKYAVINTLFSAIGGAIIGGGVTFLFTRKHFEEQAEREVEKVRLHYALIRKDQNVVDIFGGMPGSEDIVEVEEAPPGTPEQYAKAKALIRDLGYHNPNEDEPIDLGPQTDDDTSGEGEPVRIFDKAVPEEEVGEEIVGPNGQPKSKKRKVIVTGSTDPLGDYVAIPGEPYIISQQDMFNTETEWEKPSLSYYVDDDTLIDERNAIIDETHRARYVGERHLTMFGILSEDENIVYVRSPQISTDFEIIKEPGKYSVRVLGEPDYEEAEKQKLRRMRASD